MKSSRRFIGSLMALGLAVSCSALTALPTQAGITGDALSLTAVNDAGDAATLKMSVPIGPPPWVWSSNETIEMRSPTTGDLIAVLNPEGEESRVEYIDDPVINLIFSVQAGPAPTHFVVNSALLSFPTMTAQGRATVGFSLTDGDGDGATLTGTGDPNGAQGAYLAQYNGWALLLLGTTFAEVIQTMSADSFSSATAFADVPPVGFLPIADPVSDMSVLIEFDLTANDLASGTSTYVIQVPPVSIDTASWGRIKMLFR
jgi:hypothetical protein